MCVLYVCVCVCPGGRLTWSFLPLMVRLLMAQAASFWVPKSPCRDTSCHTMALAWVSLSVSHPPTVHMHAHRFGVVRFV